jgi:hypothetical protein
MFLVLESFMCRTRNLVFLMWMSFAATAYAGCPDPSAMHPQSSASYNDQPRYITRDGWISDNGAPPEARADIKLSRVDIASLAVGHHGLACVYNVVEGGGSSYI